MGRISTTKCCNWRPSLRECSTSPTKMSSKKKSKKGLTKGLISQFDPPATNLDISTTTICRKARSIIKLIVTMLDENLQLSTCQAMLEQVLGNEVIIPYLPEYYPCPHEAKAQQDFIQSFRVELGKVKIPCSKDK